MIPTSCAAGAVQRVPDRGHLAVHHAARPHQVRSGLGLGDRDAPVPLEGRVVVDVVAVGGQHAAVAVIGVFVQAQVAHHHGVVAELGAQRGDRLLADARRVPCLGPLGVLARRHPEQHERANAGLGDLDRLLAQRFERVLELAGHRGDGDRLVDAFLGEQRRDQIAGVERGLSDQRSQRGCAPEPPGTRRGVAHDLRVPGRARSGASAAARGEDALERRDHAVDRVGTRHGGHGQPVGSRLLRRHRPDAHHLRVALHRARAPRRTRARWRRW